MHAHGPAAVFGNFADPSRLVGDAFAAFLPPPEKSVAEWAAESRYLSNPGGGYTGRWNHDQAPYLVAPMEVLKGSTYLTAAFVGPAQSGKTTIGENWFGCAVETDPADFLWYMQTEAAVESFVKDRIGPMIEDHAAIKDRQGLKAVDDSLHYKRFRGMRAEFLAAVHANLISKKAPRIVLDEIDAYSESLGDVIALANFRRQTFGDESMIFAMSHCDRATGLDPDEDWKSGIMAAYKDSTRGVWYWPCPHCERVSSPAPTAKWVMTLNYPKDGTLDEIAAGTRLECPHCGVLIQDHERRAMNVAAFRMPHRGWVFAGQDITPDGEVTGQPIATRTAGFWMQGVMSPFLLEGIGGLARAVVKAERELESGSSDTALQSLRDAVVKGLGIPFTPPRAQGSIDASTLAERADPGLQLRQVPDWVGFLTAFVDVQNNYFDVMVRGWGKGGESVVIDQYKLTVSARVGSAGDPLPLDPAHEPGDWDLMLTRLTAVRYPLASDNSRGMAIRGIGYDSAGAPGVTVQAYDAWKRWKRDGKLKHFGAIGGRDVYSIMPMKGISTPRAPRLSVVYPDSQRKDRKVQTRGEIPLAQFSPNQFKTELAGQLGKAEPGEWFIHFPVALRSKAEPHEFFEQLVAESSDKAGAWTKIKPGVKNEALDQMVGTHVLAHLHGLTRLDWTKPPNWAAPHDRNSLVAPMPIEVEPTTDTAAAPAAAAPPPAKKSWIDRLAH